MNRSKIILVNLITLSRILILLPILFVDAKNYIFCAAMWAGVSDFLDGFLARKWEVTTSFGIKFDQYADKIVALFFLAIFLYHHQLSVVFVSFLLLREVLILVFRQFKWSDPQSNFLGKAKTFFLYSLFVFLSSQYLFVALNWDVKSVFMGLVLVFSWLSFLFTIPKIKVPLVYFLGTTGLSSVLLKKAPGTISSFVACVLFFVVFKSVALEYKIGLLIMVLIFHFSYYKAFLKQIGAINDDPGIYTLDETLAIILAWIFFGELSMINLLFLFSLFRFFDIMKPLGILKIEKQANWTAALRNVADDVLAICYTLIIFQLVKIYVE